MDIKKLSETAVAFIPSDATGLLIMKIYGRLSPEDNARIVEQMGRCLKDANLRCGFVAISCRDDQAFDFTLQHLTDGALREIGFQRIYSEFT